MDRRQPTTEPQTTNSEAGKSFFERKRNRLVATGITLGIGIAALTGCGPNADAQPGPEPSVTQSVETTAPTTEVTPTPTETETPIEEMTIPEDLKQYETMPYEGGFETLPIEQRLPYISWLNRDKEELADLWYKASGLAEDEYPGEITLDSSNQDIVTANSYAYRAAFTSHFNKNGINGTRVVYDVETARKIVSGAFVDAQSPDATTWDGLVIKDREVNIAAATPATVVADGGFAGSIAEPGDETNHIETVDGKEITTRTINVELGTGKRLAITFEYVAYKDYRGKDTGAFVELSRQEL